MITAKPEKIFQGNGVSPGIVLGHALKLDSHNRAIVKAYIGSDGAIEDEIHRLQRAIQLSREQLEGLKSSLEEKVGREHSFILDAHLLMLEDKSLITEIEVLIRNSRVNAEWAVRQATDRIIHAYQSLEDEYFRERRTDIENVIERILLNLSGDRPFNWDVLPGDLILVSHDFNPSSFATMDLKRVHGIALESGGRTSHTAIIARGLRLPTVMELRDFLSTVSSGDIVLLNGDDGQLIINPTPERLELLHGRIEEFLALAEPANSQSGQPTLTRDGIAVTLRANTDLPHEVRAAKRYGAEGIGLFRSEFLFFGQPHGFPVMEEQLATYKALAQEMSPYPVAIRTLDTGADKILAGMESTPQPNPSMGLRGIRLSLVARQAFRVQLEAILRASAFGKVEIVLPMISTVEEIREAKAVVKQVQLSLQGRCEGVSDSIPLGAMIEVPAAALTLEVLAAEVDFLCIGTNDLIQYMLAVDRGNPQVAHLFQPLHPSILQCLRGIAEISNRLKKPVRVCGEISSNPLFAILLLGMGFTELSMNALSIPMIRQVLRQVSRESAQSLLKGVMALATAREVAEYLVDAVSRLVQIDLQPYVKEILTPPYQSPTYAS